MRTENNAGRFRAKKNFPPLISRHKLPTLKLLASKFLSTQFPATLILGYRYGAFIKGCEKHENDLKVCAVRSYSVRSYSVRNK